MKSEEEMFNELLASLEKAGEIGHAKVVKFFVENRNDKQKLKESIIDMNTDSLSHYLNEVFLGMEEYEVCQVFKEVMDERYSNPEKMEAYASKEIEDALEGIKHARQISFIDFGAWKDLAKALSEEPVSRYFKKKYPLTALLNTEVEYYKQRIQSGDAKVLKTEILGHDELELFPGLIKKLELIYPGSFNNLTIEGDKLIISYYENAEIKEIVVEDFILE